MCPTLDETWRDHLRTGKILEEFTLGNCRAVFLKVEKQCSFMRYYFRLIVFPPGADEPVVSLNLERNPLLRTYCLGVHIDNGHENYGEAEGTISASDFKSWAVQTAQKYINLSDGPSPDPLKQISMGESRDDDGPSFRPAENFSAHAVILAKELQAEREKFFSSCLQTMQRANVQLGFKKIQMKHQSLAGEPSVIIKSFQAVHVAVFIEAQGYVIAPSTEYYIDECVSVVCTEDKQRCMPFFRRYMEIQKPLSDERGIEQFRVFSEDLALAIVGGHMGILLAPAIILNAIEFYWRSLLRVSKVFNDWDTAENLIQKIMKMN